MAVHEHEAQPLVGNVGLARGGRVIVAGLGMVRCDPGQVPQPAVGDPAPPQPVARAVGGHMDEPGHRRLGHAVTGPADDGLREGVLNAFLRRLRVAEPADERRHGTPPVFPERVRDGAGGAFVSRADRAAP